MKTVYETYFAVKLVQRQLKKISLFFMLMLAHTGAKAAVYEVYSEDSFRDALSRAYVNRESVDTILVNGVVYLSNTVNIQSKVIITGKQGYRQSKLVRNNYAFSAPLLNIQYHGVTIHNLTLQGIGQNTNVQLAKYAKWDKSNSPLINLPATNANYNPAGFNVYNVNFLDSAVGVSSIGMIPKNLNISYNTFDRVNRGVELFRDIYRANWNLGDRRDGGTLNISNNEFKGNNIRLGISVDAGNDGFPHVAPSYPDHYAQIRKDIKDKTTYFYEGSKINNNKIYNAREFGIAMATVANLYVVGNYVSTWGNEGAFSAGINVEHNANNIRIEKNQVHVATTGAFANAFTVLPYNDHGAPLNIAQASTNIVINANTITGRGQNVVFGMGYKNLSITYNNAVNFNSTGGHGVNTVLYNVPGGWSNSYAVGNTSLKTASWWVFNGNGPKAPQTYYYDSNWQLQEYVEIY